jgi:hypothetical protein
MEDRTAEEAARRQGYIDGLRGLADALAENASIPLPVDGVLTALSIGFWGDHPKEDLAATARKLPVSKWEKAPGENYFNMRGTIGALKIELYARRDAVCRRVVTGTREVTEIVKDPEKLAEVPEIEVTRTEQTYEWVCDPVMSPGAQDETAAAGAEQKATA